jgi:hypothetical protein
MWGKLCTRGPIPGTEAAVYGFGFCRTLLSLTLWNIEGLVSEDISKLPYWTRWGELIDGVTRRAATGDGALLRRRKIRRLP